MERFLIRGIWVFFCFIDIIKERKLIKEFMNAKFWELILSKSLLNANLRLNNNPGSVLQLWSTGAWLRKLKQTCSSERRYYSSNCKKSEPKRLGMQKLQDNFPLSHILSLLFCMSQTKRFQPHNCILKHIWLGSKTHSNPVFHTDSIPYTDITLKLKTKIIAI